MFFEDTTYGQACIKIATCSIDDLDEEGKPTLYMYGSNKF